jgi:Tripartite tricarboxylate transporter TctB family
MKLKPSSYFLIGLLLFALFAFVNSLLFARLKIQLVPLIMSGMIIVLAGVELFREIRREPEVEKAKETKVGEEDLEFNTKGQLKDYIIIFCWLIGFFTGIYVVGFVAAIAIFICAYLKWYGHAWLKSIGLAAAATIIIYLVFVILLQLELYRGIIPEFIWG